MKITIDRIEGKFAVCESEDMMVGNIPLFLLPEGICEGDVLLIERDDIEAARRSAEIKKLMDDVWKD